MKKFKTGYSAVMTDSGWKYKADYKTYEDIVNDLHTHYDHAVVTSRKSDVSEKCEERMKEAIQKLDDFWKPRIEKRVTK